MHSLFFEATDLALGFSNHENCLLYCQGTKGTKLSPTEAVILPTTKLRLEFWKINLEKKVLLWPPGCLWSETRTFKGWFLLEAASHEIFLVLAHLIFESSGQLCRTSQKPSRDIGRRVRSFSGRNSHMCLNRKTKPRRGHCEKCVVNTVEPC